MFTRFRHLIRPNASTRAPSQFVAVQAVDNRTLHKGNPTGRQLSLRSVTGLRWRIEAGRVTRQQWVYYEELSDFWEWFYGLLTPDRQTWLWCDDLIYHASLLALWKELDSGRITHRTACLASRVGYLSLRAGESRSVWVDRRNWWTQPYKEWLSGISEQSAEPFTPTDIVVGEGDTTFESVQKIAASVTSLVRFVRQNDFGVLRLTAAGQSLQAYRHKFGPREIESYVPKRGRHAGQTKTRTLVLPRTHNLESALAMERDSLHGGRVDCRFIGRVKSKVYCLDCTALYPAVMLDNLFPCALGEKPSGTQMPVNWFELDKARSIARVVVKTDQPIYPFKKNGITVYPVGQFETVLTGPELSHACSKGHMVRCLEWQWYRMAPLFSRYVETLWKLRRFYESKGNAVWSELVKTLMNALHGKFSQRVNEWEETEGIMPAKRWGYWPDLKLPERKIIHRRSIAGKVQTHQKGGWADHAFPAIPAFVYSYARLKMQEFFSHVKEGKIYYSAIDSIHTDQTGYEELCHAGVVFAGQLGRLRLVGVADEARYYGIGKYDFGSKKVRSGQPAGAVENGNGEVTWLEHDHVHEVLSRGPAGKLTIRGVRIKPDRVFRHGRVGRDGWVKPFKEGR